MDVRKLAGAVLCVAGVGYLVWELHNRLSKREIPPTQPTPATIPKKSVPKQRPPPTKQKPPVGKPSVPTKPSKPQPPAIVLKVSKTVANEGEVIDAYVDINRNPGVPPNVAPAMSLQVGKRAVTPPFNAPLNRLPWHLHFKVHAGPVIQKFIDVPAIFGLCPGTNDLCFSIWTGDKVFRSNVVKVNVIRRSSFNPISFKASITKVDDKRAKLHIDMLIKPQPIDMPLIIEWDVPSILVGQDWMMVTRKFITVPRGRSNISIDIVASVRDPAYPNKHHNPMEFHSHKVVVWKPCDYGSRLTKVIHV